MVEKENSFYVEHLLPKDFLYLLGVYVQTCAHIEQVVCVLCVCLDGIPPENENFFSSYATKRKLPAKELLKLTQTYAGKAAQYGFSDELNELCDWLNRFLTNRHIAVHGAFVGSPYGFVRVDYLHKSKERKVSKHEHERTPITREIVDVVCNDANRILVIATGMIEAIESGLFVRASRVVFPVVTHPSSTPK